MTKKELISALINSNHPDDTQVCIYLNEEERIEENIGDIVFIDSLVTSNNNRLDINAVYQSFIDADL